LIAPAKYAPDLCAPEQLRRWVRFLPKGSSPWKTGIGTMCFAAQVAADCEPTRRRCHDCKAGCLVASFRLVRRESKMVRFGWSSWNSGWSFCA